MVLTIDLTKEEQELAESYAKLNSIPVAEAMKNIFFEKLEDEYDTLIADEAYEAYVKDGCKTYSHEEAWAMLGE